MEIHSLPKITEKKLRRLGRGHGSGRGKTAGRGTKGQKARGNVPLAFEGGALPLVKRMPFLRGRGRNKPNSSGLVGISLENLSVLPSKTIVDVATLIKYKVVNSAAKKTGVKILGVGDIKSSLTIKIPISESAKKKIEKAGGSVIL